MGHEMPLRLPELHLEQPAVVAAQRRVELAENPARDILRRRLRDYIVDIGVVEPVKHKLVDGPLEVHEVENHPLRVRLAFKHDPQPVRMPVQPLALPMIMYKIMRRIKLEIPAQQHCAIPPEYS